MLWVKIANKLKEFVMVDGGNFDPHKALGNSLKSQGKSGLPENKEVPSQEFGNELKEIMDLLDNQTDLFE